MIAGVAAFEERMAVRRLDPAVVALRQHISGAVEKEMARLRAKYPSDVAADVELALHRVTQSLLHTPTLRAKELARTGDGARLPAGAAHPVRHRHPRLGDRRRSPVSARLHQLTRTRVAQLTLACDVARWPTVEQSGQASPACLERAERRLDGRGRPDHAGDRVQGLQAVAGVEDRPSRRPGRADRWPAACAARATVTPPAVSAKMPSVRASSLMPSTTSSSLTSSTAPPVRRVTSST